MGKTSRAIFAGVGAGLTQFGQQYGAKIAQDKADARVDARLEKEDAFKDRQLDIQEQDADLRRKAMERQAILDEAKIRHGKLIVGLNDAGKDMNLVGKAYSDNLPDGKQWHFNDSATKEQGAYAVFNIGHRVKDPGTGEYIIDETTGLPMERPNPLNNGQKVFQTQEEYTAWMVNVVNPTYGLALITQRMDDERAFNNAKKMHDWKATTDEGKAALAATKAGTGLDIAKTGQAERSPAGSASRVPNKMLNLDGSEVVLSIKEMEQRKDDAKAWQENIPGVTAQEVRYIEQGSVKFRGAMKKMAQEVVNSGDDPKTISDAIDMIRDKFNVSKTTAEGILAIEQRGVVDDSPSWLDKFLGSSKVAGTDISTSGGGF